MSKLLVGCISISHADILEKLGLTPDSVLHVENGNGEIIVNVVASDENKQDWLTNNEDQHWIIRKTKLELK